MRENEKIEEIIRSLPDAPGVYQYFDKEKVLLYVGKAKNLKKRVSSYFTKEHDSARIEVLVRKIADIKYIITKSELDALLLENTLIKTHRPRYNIALRDDKSYPSICIKKEEFPRVFSTRRLIKDGSEYFGPYASVKMMNELLDVIRQIYPLRTCNFLLSEENIRKEKFRVCLEYHIGNCLGPCEGKQTGESYLSQLSGVKQLIRGDIGFVLRGMKEQMKEFSENLEFEKAQRLKNKIELLEKFQARSTVVSSTVGTVDVFGMASDDKYTYVNYLQVKEGLLIQAYTLEMKRILDEKETELLELAVTELRQRFSSSAKEIILPVGLNYGDLEITVPQRGDKKLLLEMSERNARFYMLDKHRQESVKNPERNTERIMETMKKDLRLTEQPRHIECFDNSNFQGTNAVSACVVFKDGKPSKKEYRHFNVKTVEGPDDFATMEEVIWRRYSRLLGEQQPLPQLVIIDGGKGQLSAAMNSLEKLGLKGKMAVIGIAKKLEEIYYPGDSLPLYIDKRSETLRIIQHLRNEAHRFGITHHRKRRNKSVIKSELMQIEGIGEKTMELLLKKFKSIKRIKAASEEELEKIVGKHKAKVVKKALDENI